MEHLKFDSIGEAWIGSCDHIFKRGEPSKDGDKHIRESMNLVVTINNPTMTDPLVKKFADKAMIDWMMANFLEQKRVPELKNAWSYGKRIFNYNGKDQLKWVISKLKEKPETKGATIPMLMPNEDEGYIPCVSMLDFKIRDDKLMLVAMCRSIDFGKKVYANMLALHKIQDMVSSAVKVRIGPILMYVVSAHIYDDDYDKIKDMMKKAGIKKRGRR